ncbi:MULTISPECIES: cobalt-precorrin-4 methyltransferase [Aerococcus]|uniref:cobalt-precorrin-4 methyltransferase n=1 Tax=Aerococcus urinae (strain CCUG 59500 / ACS-120-V-Col10a) TaxID=2976812 RepID=UPI000200E7C1|nr:cobalt-precorrin-4 methyltransferase [Aerococcus sp. Group 1]AEA00867.1 precorrin-4 C(11)-methyltransferase [Aerococcus sp. Group 1]MCY3030024.1 cobalt-precorrin-4 methyltransferase [Aerococcus sp. Group 1]MCY3054769.1 cobalt-precorrin-4 methyltransferase [Aerococcus sp. Group 1]MCY3056499.1 cobalt-precorrin-4 methyltransferase [Aerococcus sp. Group 1]MCY3061178.1 cobalt-precorrin-4 methyltransferase [Aerococcus sp. Group 1]
MAKVTFVGAGPGDVELITLKGYKALAEADRVIYAGSLINKDLLDYCKSGAETYDSAKLDLNEILALIEEAIDQDQEVVRLHTGDASLYGSIREQIEELKQRGIDFAVIPGVSSFLGAAAAIGTEYTVPEVSQSLIITRMAGRTPVPEKENLRSLASHQTSMAIFLSVQNIQGVVEELLAGGYSKDTPAVVIYKATWPQEKQVVGTLADIAEKTQAAGIKLTALILVGNFLGEEFYYSKLYDTDFSHGFRN